MRVVLITKTTYDFVEEKTVVNRSVSLLFWLRAATKYNYYRLTTILQQKSVNYGL